MGIFDKFHHSLSKALTDYQAEQANQDKQISGKHRIHISHLEKILLESKTIGEKHDAVLLRLKIEKFLDEMDVPWIARTIPILFGDDLYETIKAVLDNPHYSHLKLMAKERAESYARQTKILMYLENGDTSGLLNTIETLENELETSQQINERLKIQSNQLQIDNDNLIAENEELRNKNQRLEARNRELEAEIARGRQPKRPLAKSTGAGRNREQKEETYQPSNFFPKR